MAYCSNCGSYIPIGEDVCPACGAGSSKPAGSKAAKASSAPNSAKTHKFDWDKHIPAEKTSGEYKAPKGEYNYKYDSSNKQKREGSGGKGGPSNYSSEYGKDAEENKGLGLLCYLGPLLLIPLHTKPDSQFLRYHCNQGLLLMIFCILSNICFSIPVIGWVAGIIGWGIGITNFFRGISNVSNGKRSPLKPFGNITLIK